MNTVAVTPRLAELPRSLAELWEKAEALDRNRALSRSLTLNLLVVTDAVHEDEMREIVDHLPTQHPCRAVLVVVDEAAGDLRGELTASVREQGRCRALVLEKLVLIGDRSQHPRLPSLIRPLLVNDIPTQLFWGCPLPNSFAPLAALAAMAERTVVDSALFAGDDWLSLQRGMGRRPLDLSWLRLTPWRQSLAEAFERFTWSDEPQTRVLIEHGRAPGSMGATRGLQQWLIDKLNAQVRLVGLPGSGPEAEPWRLQLDCGDVTIQIRHLLNEPALVVDVSLPDRCLLPTRTKAIQSSRAELLAAAIDLRTS